MEERAGLACLEGRVDCARVRLHRADTGGPWRQLVLWASRGRAIALGNDVFLPSRCERDLAVLAHELTHCGQYQAWGAVRYYLRGAAVQFRDLLHRSLGAGGNPYAYRLEPDKPFESYGMEQQAMIIEDASRGRSLARAIGLVARAR